MNELSLSQYQSRCQRRREAKLVGHGVTVYGLAGFTDSDYGYNGSGNGYHLHKGFSGQNAGGGVEYRLTKNLSLDAHLYHAALS